MWTLAALFEYWFNPVLIHNLINELKVGRVGKKMDTCHLKYLQKSASFFNCAQQYIKPAWVSIHPSIPTYQQFILT